MRLHAAAIDDYPMCSSTVAWRTVKMKCENRLIEPSSIRILRHSPDHEPLQLIVQVN